MNISKILLLNLLMLAPLALANGKLNPLHKNEGFKNIIESDQHKDKIIILDFHASWCGPCKRMTPALQSVAAAHANDVYVLTIDIDQHKYLLGELGIDSIPTLFFYENGKLKKRVQGAKNKNELEALISECRSRK